MQPQYITNTERPSFVRAALGYSDGYYSERESDPFRPPDLPPSAIPDYPQTFTSSSGRHDTLSPLADQGTAQFVLDAPSQSLKTPCSTAIGKQTEAMQNAYIDPNKGEEGGGNKCARKRRCGVGRANGYNTGCEIEDTATSFPDSRHLQETVSLEAGWLTFCAMAGFPERTSIPSPAEPRGLMGEGCGAEDQGDSAYDGKHWGFFRDPTASIC